MHLDHNLYNGNLYDFEILLAASMGWGFNTSMINRFILRMNYFLKFLNKLLLKLMPFHKL